MEHEATPSPLLHSARMYRHGSWNNVRRSQHTMAHMSSVS